MGQIQAHAQQPALIRDELDSTVVVEQYPVAVETSIELRRFSVTVLRQQSEATALYKQRELLGAFTGLRQTTNLTDDPKVFPFQIRGQQRSQTGVACRDRPAEPEQEGSDDCHGYWSTIHRHAQRRGEGHQPEEMYGRQIGKTRDSGNAAAERDHP